MNTKLAEITIMLDMLGQISTDERLGGKTRKAAQKALREVLEVVPKAVGASLITEIKDGPVSGMDFGFGPGTFGIAVPVTGSVPSELQDILGAIAGLRNGETTQEELEAAFNDEPKTKNSGGKK